ncbi:putative membrane protein [Microbacterium proteolyticum]|uniref:Putative membrane protein n=1 Tax=Microbacterium proteolyticum TaxID=1572644 RepID=A0A7W5CGH9_9MICO|nr:putative membrane protein [Microbacterium proteolyticum]
MSTALPSVDPETLLLPRLGGLSRRFAAVPSLHVGAAVLSVLLGGLLLSMATTSDPLWWQLHFSQLGIFGDFSSALFNTTLKISGLMVVVFALFVRRDIRRLGRGTVRRGSATLACICLNVVGISLALVGCVPLNTDKDLHDRVAAMMVLGFLVLLVSAPVMLRRLGSRMAVSTGVALVWLALSITLFVTAMINLALFETISCGAMFAWSGMLTHTLGAVALRAEGRPGATGRGTACGPHRRRLPSAGRRVRLAVGSLTRSIARRRRLASSPAPSRAAIGIRRHGHRRPSRVTRVSPTPLAPAARRLPPLSGERTPRRTVPGGAGIRATAPSRATDPHTVIPASRHRSPLGEVPPRVSAPRQRRGLRRGPVSAARGARDGSPDGRPRLMAAPRLRRARPGAPDAARSPLR